MTRHSNWLERILQHPATDECIPHGKPDDGSGYGACWYDGKPRRVHRVVWAIVNEQEIPEGMVIRHTCDNRGCTNPRHLLLGTVADNNWDRSERGTWESTYGEKHGRAKLTESQVREIRDSSLSSRRMALLLGVAPSTIKSIRNRETWRHVA